MEKLCFQKKLGSFQTKKHKLGTRNIHFCKKWTQFLLLLGIFQFPKTAKFPLNLVTFSQTIPALVPGQRDTETRKFFCPVETLVHAYFLNHLPLSQQWIEIHFEVLSLLHTFMNFYTTF